MTPDLERTLLAAVSALDAQGLRHAVVGGLALSAWAVPRATKDVDLYAELRPATLPSLRQELEARGFEVPAMEPELRRFGVFRSRSSEGVFLDIFDAVGPLGEAVLNRRRRVVLDGHPLWLVAPEELAVLKAFSDRDRDFHDLRELAAALGEALDVGYVEQWVKKLDESVGTSEVSDRLRRALAAARARRGR